MARMFAAGVFADQIAGVVEEAFKFLFTVELRHQRLPDNFGFNSLLLRQQHLEARVGIGP